MADRRRVKEERGITAELKRDDRFCSSWNGDARTKENKVTYVETNGAEGTFFSGAERGQKGIFFRAEGLKKTIKRGIVREARNN